MMSQDIGDSRTLDWGFGCGSFRGAAKAALRGAGMEADPYFGQDRLTAQRFQPRAGHRYAKDGYARWVELVESILR